MSDLKRFHDAQDQVYPRVIEELKSGKKKSHWIWFIFPQLDGLGYSVMSQRYAISSLQEAQAYCRDPILYDRLVECCDLLLVHRNKPIGAIMGSPDDLKLRSSMTLFTIAEPKNPIFREVIDAFFGGALDPKTGSLACI